MRELPTGTVTLLFSDIEGSTRLLHELGDAYGNVLEDRRRLLREVFGGRGGVEVDTQGDAFFYAFTRASEAVHAAAEAQRALVETPVRVRMGIHTGEPSRSAEGYVGADIHRAARIMAAAHGGQVLVSDATRGLLEDEELDRFALRDLGEHRLKDLTRPQRLHQLVVSGLPSDFPPPRTLEGHTTNLPIQPTTLIGRDRELAELGDVLRRPDVRLLTLTGPGGTGKTRLALQLAANAVEEFPDGVFLVPLATIVDARLVIPTIAQTLGVRESGGRTVAAALGDYVAERGILLVLDNFEQVVDAAADVTGLLEAHSALKLVVTTREPLHVAGEQEWPVQPLDLPRPDASDVEALSQFDAVRLFIERARAVRPDFAVTNENAPAVAEICVRLDGLPLAIELAAARVKSISISDLLARLDRRLVVLTGGGRTTPERQRTLRNAIDWSYSLLEEEERTLFARLAVFAGGCTLEAAEDVCDCDLDALAALVDKSLIRETDGVGGGTRFSMLKTIREYALERLVESPDADNVRSRQVDYYVALAQAAQEPLRHRGRREWAARLDEEQDNLRAVLEWSLVRAETERPLKIASAIWFYWLLRGRLTEGR